MVGNVWRIAIFLAFLVTACLGQEHGAAKRTVSGTVVNEKGEAVVGASVNAVLPGQSQPAQSGGRNASQTTTDGQGRFSFDLPVRDLRLEVTGPYLVPASRTVA